jgi:hypothetical protein
VKNNDFLPVDHFTEALEEGEGENKLWAKTTDIAP